MLNSGGEPVQEARRGPQEEGVSRSEAQVWGEQGGSGERPGAGRESRAGKAGGEGPGGDAGHCLQR